MNAYEQRLLEDIKEERNAILAIAQALAAKHIRGNVTCTACHAVKYMGGFEHNPGCPVLQLEAYEPERSTTTTSWPS